MRVIKVWLAVLTVALGVFAAIVVVLEIRSDDADEQGVVGDLYKPTERQVAAARAEVEEAYGDQLESVTVRVVRVDMPEEAAADVAMGEGPPPLLYIEYRLRGFETVIAGTTMDPYSTAAAAGMLPTKGSLLSRMTEEQFEVFLAAYAEATSAPLGGVRRYGDSPVMPGQVTADTVKSGGRTYRTDELWAAREGALVDGDTIGFDDPAFMQATAHIFHEDPRTGEFTYLGTEPAVWW
jgi:hypothetical protein